MNKYIAIVGILLGILLAGCQDELEMNGADTQRNPGKGLPITFTTEILPREVSGGVLTRVTVNDDYKQEFIEVTEGEDGMKRGDFLHVSATFTLLGEDGQPVESGAETVTQYECLQFENGEWHSTDNTVLTWPWNAEEGTFTVYYMSGSNGLLTVNDPEEFELSNVTYDTDPLMAVAENVPYGYAVPLVFHHLCTKLSIIDVSTRGSEYWAKITREDGTRMANQFSLTRNGNNELTFAFKTKDADENPYVSTQRTEEGYVSYYLAPGDYEGMSLTYRYDRPYLTLNLEELNNLEKEHSYVVSITDNQGSISIDEDEDDWWEEPGENVDEVELDQSDIDGFLKAICDGTAYSHDGTPVLAVIEEGTELLVNVKFNSDTFGDHDLPNTVFDGNYHYIQCVKRPLFNLINGGRIQNLSMYNVEIKQEKVTSVGAIARESTQEGEAIRDVRLHDISIEVTPTENYNQACDVGALIGVSNSTMSDIYLGGNISVKAYTIDTERQLGTINVGGLIGQLNASGQLNNVSRLEEETTGCITVNSSCTNKLGDRNTGGLVGLSNGHVADCVLNNATVDASQTRGIMVYTGGLVGMARGTVGTHAATINANGIFNSTYSGIIKCGRAYSTNTEGEESVEGHAYAGGAVGYAYWSDNIEGNEIFGTIEGPIGDGEEEFTPWENSIYATGGLFGQAYNAPTSGNTTWISFEDVGSNDSEKEFYVGKIAGRADENSTVNFNTSHVTGNWENIGATVTSIQGE